MATLSCFELAAGTSLGRDHRRVEKSNQDAYSWRVTDVAIAAVVADGCGSGRHSEVGAQLGARVACEALVRGLCCDPSADPARLLAAARADVLAQLRVLARAMGGPLAALVSDYFLFTLLGAAVTPAWTALFAIGDGILALNGAITTLGPFADDAPPYLGYALLSEDHPGAALTALQLLPTAELRSCAVATDGARDVADLPALWTDDRYFENPDALRRRLATLNRDRVRPDWARQRLEREPGALRDDTTIVALRRRA